MFLLSRNDENQSENGSKNSKIRPRARPPAEPQKKMLQTKKLRSKSWKTRVFFTFRLPILDGRVHEQVSSVLFFTVFFEGERHDLSKTGGFGRKMGPPPPPGKPVTFYECHPEDHAPAPSVRADFSIIHFSRKWPSRMTNLSRQVYIQIIYTSVDQAKIDFITLALVSRNCPTYFSLLPLVSITCPTMSNLFHCFFHWFSAVVRHIATFYHRLSSVVQSISLVWASAFISFFFPVFGNNFKRSSLFKKHTSGARSDQLPFLDGFVTTIFLQFYAVLFFDNSLFPEMAVQDDQSVKTSIYTNDIHICWSGQNRFHHFSIGFTQLSNLFQPFAIGFNQLSNHVQPISLFFSLVFSSCSTYCNILP